MNNVVTTLAPSFLIGSSSFLQATSKPIIYGFEIRPDQTLDFGLTVLERLKKSP